VIRLSQLRYRTSRTFAHLAYLVVLGVDAIPDQRLIPTSHRVFDVTPATSGVTSNRRCDVGDAVTELEVRRLES